MVKYVIVLVFIFLATCLGVGFFSFQFGVNAAVPSDSIYNDGYKAGFRIGNSEGFVNGFSEGNASGYSAGYNIGFNNGCDSVPVPTKAPDRYNEGYISGVLAGKSQGYVEGFSAGKIAGFSSGYDAGYVNGTKDGTVAGYNIRDPTYAEMQDFITSDKTNLNIYNLKTYNCFCFTRDVLANAFNVGIKAGFVYIEFPEIAHAIVAFNTVDKGLVFVEPQTDNIMTMSIGLHYWDRSIFKEPGYDDTIKSFTIIW